MNSTHRIVALVSTAVIAALALAGCAVPLQPAASATSQSVTVTITGGMDTDPVDNGRPVVLVAAALGVPTQVFRTAFSGVSPAGAGNDVSTERAQANKAALLKVLAPYGITNDRLDAASDFYRYNGSAGQTWQHHDATATATVVGGTVTEITVTDAGFGYSSTPTIKLSNGQAATAIVGYGTDTATNGSITSITLDH